MKKQRICIVGDGLSGLMAALALNKLENLDVHLISKKNKHFKDKSTTAISAYKPPIFWKEKELLKHQVKIWDYNNIKNLLT